MELKNTKNDMEGAVDLNQNEAENEADLEVENEADPEADTMKKDDHEAENEADHNASDAVKKDAPDAENEAENEVNDAVKKDDPDAENEAADKAEDPEFYDEIKVEKTPSDEPEPPKDEEPDMDAESLEKYRRFISLGLTPDEAFRATGYRKNQKKTMATSPISVTNRAISISEADLRAARQIFTTLTDREINNLYRRVTE